MGKSQPFMALFGRDRLPSRSALSRALAALRVPVIETLRTLFLADLLARSLGTDAEVAGLWDRRGQQWRVFDLDFTHLPQQSFTVVDVVERYLHRGAFESTLSDEDDELDSDSFP